MMSHRQGLLDNITIDTEKGFENVIVATGKDLQRDFVSMAMDFSFS